jgi:hypothetical protein
MMQTRQIENPTVNSPKPVAIKIEEDDDKFKKLPEADQCKQVLLALQEAQNHVSELKLEGAIKNYQELLDVLEQIKDIGDAKYQEEIDRIKSEKHLYSETTTLEMKQINHAEDKKAENASSDITDEDFLYHFKDINKAVFFRLYFITRDYFKLKNPDARDFEIVRIKIRGAFYQKIKHIIEFNTMYKENCASAVLLIVQTLKGAINKFPDKVLRMYDRSVKNRVENILCLIQLAHLTSIEKIEQIRLKILLLLKNEEVMADFLKEREYAILLKNISVGLCAPEIDVQGRIIIHENLAKELAKPKQKHKPKVVKIEEPEPNEDDIEQYGIGTP